MKKKVFISANIQGKTGTISISVIRAREKKWIAESMMDAFLVDDAYYDCHDGMIHLENWDSNIETIPMEKEIPNWLTSELGRDMVEWVD